MSEINASLSQIVQNGTPENISRSRGRPPGSPNRRSELVRKILDQHNFCPVKEILEEINNLKSADKVFVCLRLMEFIYPRKKAIALAPDMDSLLPQDDAEAINQIADLRAIAAKRINAKPNR